MTVANRTPKDTYTADDVTTVFPYTWMCYDSDDIAVYKVDGSTREKYDNYFDYTVSGTENPDGGNIIFKEAPVDGSKILVISDAPYEQKIDIKNTTVFDARAIERGLDKTTLLASQLNEKYNRTLQVSPIEDTIGYLPVVSERLSRLLAFDPAGDPTYTNYTADEIASIFPTLSGSTMTTAYFSILGTVSGSSSLHLRPDDQEPTKAWDITANAAGDLQFINYATGSGITAFTIGASSSSSTYAQLVDGVLSLESSVTTLSGAYNSIENTVETLTSDLEFSNYWATTLSGIYADIFNKSVDTIDDVADGVTYGKVLNTSISAGQILLSAVLGNMDDIVNGSTYGKVLLTALSAGQILLSAVIGDLDDIANGDTYSKTYSTIVDAGYIYMLRRSGSSANTLSITTDSIEAYIDSVKTLEILTAGEVRLGNQASLWSKQSTAGFYLYSASTELASFTASAATVGKTSSFHSISSTTGISFKNSSTTLFSLNSYGYTSTVQPCFMRYASTQAKVTGDTTYYTVVFANVDHDQNSNTTSTTFTAPADGKYWLSVCLNLYGLSSSHGIVTMYICTSKMEWIHQMDPVGTFDKVSLQKEVLASMDAGDTAYIKVVVAGGSKSVGITGYGAYSSGLKFVSSYFQGVKIC